MIKYLIEILLYNLSKEWLNKKYFKEINKY